MHTIFIGSDHAGFMMKEEVRKVLDEFNTSGYTKIQDVGCYSIERCDYPEFAFRVAKKVRDTPNSFGILICGTGIGMSIAANKVKGIRCALCHNFTSVSMARKHNNANIIAVGACGTTSVTLLPLITGFLNIKFEGGKHKKRIDLIHNIED